MVWECREHYHGFNMNSGYDLAIIVEPSKSRSAAPMLECIITGRKPWFPGSAHAWVLWHKILDAYAQTALTVETDRLIALTGMISAIERLTGWRNIDGLWEFYMALDLLWMNTDRKNGSQAVEGPSWS
jgi:hypothetical protein